MSSRFSHRLAIGMACVLIVIVAGLALAWTAIPPNRTPKAEVSCLAPSENPDQPAQARAYAEVEFVYEIKNCGSVPLRGVRPNMACQCNISRPAPAEIAPGKAGVFAITLRAPLAGTAQRRVEVTCEGLTTPLTVLEPSIHVPVEPPLFLAKYGGTSLAFVEGENAGGREVVFQTVERSGTESWIQNIEVDPADLVQTSVKNVIERSLEDPDFVQRT